MVGEQSKESIMTEEEESQTDQSEETVIDLDNHQQDDNETDNNAHDELEEKNKAIQQEKDEMYERLLRIQAEYDNIKKRTQKERIAERKYKSQDLVTELLPALDNFERALQVDVTDETKGIIDGITMVYNQINEALASEGVDVIETVGKEFDPHLHHAVMQEDDDEQPSNTVVEELQKGYKLNDRVIRPAMVKVNK